MSTSKENAFSGSSSGQVSTISSCLKSTATPINANAISAEQQVSDDLQPQESYTSFGSIQPMERDTHWGNRWQFILACVGFAVGLGNIWRFPILAYKNGGGAFLIPYLFSSLVIGFPFVYLEMALGQFSQTGPAVVHGRLRPVLQGLGWAMAGISITIAIFYNVIVGWILIYIYTILTGCSYQWSTCRNGYNTIHCTSLYEDANCTDVNHEKSFFFNNTCFLGNNTVAQATRNAANIFNVSAAEEFFNFYVLERDMNVMENGLGGLNYQVVIGLAFAWIVTALVLFKGVKLMGYASYVTATIPYIIIFIMFLRAVTLDGAEIGLEYYGSKSNFSKLWEPTVWTDAASQVSFSLSIGVGGMLSLSSYSPRTHNVYRDALIISLADGFMSIFGGSAVFSVLGFMAKQSNKSITEVAQSGPGLAFIVYPEATGLMPLPWLWALLFFVMLFLLGVSSQFGLTEVACTAIYDQFPSLRAHRGAFSFAISGALFLIGLIMCTRAGIYYFNIFNAYSASFSVMIVLFLELILVIYVYGIWNFLEDLRSMFGYARTRLGRIFGPTGYYVQFIWFVLAPVQTMLILILIVTEQIKNPATYKIYGVTKYYPFWGYVIGWIISTVPLIMLPVMIVYNILKFKRRGQGWEQLFRLQHKWPSYELVKQQGGGWRDGFNRWFKEGGMSGAVYKPPAPGQTNRVAPMNNGSSSSSSTSLRGPNTTKDKWTLDGAEDGQKSGVLSQRNKV